MRCIWCHCHHRSSSRCCAGRWARWAQSNLAAGCGVDLLRGSQTLAGGSFRNELVCIFVIVLLIKNIFIHVYRLFFTSTFLICYNNRCSALKMCQFLVILFSRFIFSVHYCWKVVWSCTLNYQVLLSIYSCIFKESFSPPDHFSHLGSLLECAQFYHLLFDVI